MTTTKPVRRFWRYLGFAAAACVLVAGSVSATVWSMSLRRSADQSPRFYASRTDAPQTAFNIDQSAEGQAQMNLPSPTGPIAPGQGQGQPGRAQKPAGGPMVAYKDPPSPVIRPSWVQSESFGKSGKAQFMGSSGDLKQEQSRREQQAQDSETDGRTVNDLSAIRPNAGAFITEGYDAVVYNKFLSALDNPLSTFSIDVDTASYSNMRRFLSQGQLPPPGAIRVEELINYFSYDYPQPEGERPFSIMADATSCPWNAKHRLVRIGLKGREIAADKRPASNLVFLLDVSGSMADANKLPLVREGMKLLVSKLNEKDRVAIVAYAGSAGLVLDSTPASSKETIIAALDKLSAGGCTNGAGGITQAYEVATANFIKGGVNRVILCTDGDFNVGVTNQGDLVKLIEEKAKAGTFLTVLGFGMGNLKDTTLVKLADKGNGNYGYIDTLGEARKMLAEQLSGTLVTIAKDVKIQVEFNPGKVAGYRLIGYEKRILAKEDFNDDTKDAGEIGAGHTVTALYEVVPAGRKVESSDVDPLKYQRPANLTTEAANEELLTVKLRYKAPDGDKSSLIEQPLKDSESKFDKAGVDMKFVASVAAFGMIMRGDKNVGTYNLDAVAELAGGSVGPDASGYRAEFVELVKKAKQLSPAPAAR